MTGLIGRGVEMAAGASARIAERAAPGVAEAEAVATKTDMAKAAGLGIGIATAAGFGWSIVAPKGVDNMAELGIGGLFGAAALATSGPVRAAAAGVATAAILDGTGIDIPVT